MLGRWFPQALFLFLLNESTTSPGNRTRDLGHYLAVSWRFSRLERNAFCARAQAMFMNTDTRFLRINAPDFTFGYFID